MGLGFCGQHKQKPFVTSLREYRGLIINTDGPPQSQELLPPILIH